MSLYLTKWTACPKRVQDHAVAYIQLEIIILGVRDSYLHRGVCGYIHVSEFQQLLWKLL